MSHLLRIMAMAALIPCSGTFLARGPVDSVRAAPSHACPVLYRYSDHRCYPAPSAFEIRHAERQMSVPILDPVAAVRQFTALPLTSVIVDRTRRDTGVLHPWIINYVFGDVPDLGLPSATVSPSATFLVIGESAGHIALTIDGRNVYDRPQFLRIRVNGRGRAIWHVSVNLPRRNASLVIHSTLPRPILERLVAALMLQSAQSVKLLA